MSTNPALTTCGNSSILNYKFNPRGHAVTAIPYPLTYAREDGSAIHIQAARAMYLPPIEHKPQQIQPLHVEMIR